MSKRYEKIEFKDFSGGQFQEFLQVENKFLAADKIEISDSKKIELTKKFVETEINFSPVYAPVATLGNKVYIAGYFGTPSNQHALVEITQGVTPVIRKDLDSVYGSISSVYYLVSFNGKMLVQFFDGTNTLKYYTASTVTGTWTEVTGLPATGDYAIINSIDTGNELYLLFATGLYKTSDLTTFTLVSSPPAGYYFHYSGLEIVGGQIFVSAFSKSSSKKIKILRVLSDGFDEIYRTEGIHSLGENNGNLVITTFKDRKYRVFIYDFESVRQIAVSDTLLESYSKVGRKTYLAGEYYNWTTSAYADLKLFSLENDSIVQFWSVNPNASAEFLIVDLAVFDSYLYFIAHDVNTGKTKIYISSQTEFELTGSIETSIIDKGEISPKQIILRHRPLPANTSVKVYKKENFATSWTLILTSDTDNAIKKTYTWPNGIKIDFLQFKIELITTDDDYSPEDVQFDFLYLPVGLESAK